MKLSKLRGITVFVLIALNVTILPSSIAGPVTMPVTAVIATSITEAVTTDLDFGSIDLAPGGTTVTIDADAAQPATPTATGATVVTGGNSGIITITSAIIVTVDVTYPAANVTLTSGGGDTLTMIAADIGLNSQYPDAGANAGTVNTDGVNPLLIYVGGEIVIPAAQPTGTYTGSMTLTINYS